MLFGFGSKPIIKGPSPLAKPGTNINEFIQCYIMETLRVIAMREPAMTSNYHIAAMTRGQISDLVREVRARSLRGARRTRGRTGLADAAHGAAGDGSGQVWSAAPGPLSDRVQLPRRQTAPGAGRLPGPHRCPPPLPRQRSVGSRDPSLIVAAPSRRPCVGTLVDGQSQAQILPATGGGQAFCNGWAGLLPTRMPGRPAGSARTGNKSSRHPTASAANLSLICRLRAWNQIQRG